MDPAYLKAVVGKPYAERLCFNTQCKLVVRFTSDMPPPDARALRQDGRFVADEVLEHGVAEEEAGQHLSLFPRSELVVGADPGGLEAGLVLQIVEVGQQVAGRIGGRFTGAHRVDDDLGAAGAVPDGQRQDAGR